ncbi:MAG: MFS transporter [Gammaproteobacteria bacterium]|nr:MFS transporter [Gammaproteobacteria bacterium]
MGTQTQRDYWLLSGALFTFFLTWSFAFSLFPIWLNQAIGLTGESTGIVFSINALAALLIQPSYGFIQDKLGLKKHLLYITAAFLILSGPFFVFIYGPLLAFNLTLGAAVGGVYFGLAFSAGVGTLESYTERVSRVVGFEFGKARLWGSLGWAAATFCAGYLFNKNPNINFWMASLSAMAFLILLLLVHPANTPEQEQQIDQKASTLNISDALSLFTNRQFWAFAIFVMGVSSIYTTYDQQFPVYFSSLFPSKAEGNAMYGYLNSFQVFLEAGGMFLAPFIVNRIGAKNGLVLAGVIMATRMIGSGFAEGPIGISCVKLLHAAELPIMLVSVFKYISATFDARLSATLYLIGFQFVTQISASVFSIIAGGMYDRLGFADSYIILGTIVASFVIVCHFILTCDRQTVASKGMGETDSDYQDAFHTPAAKELT